MSAVEDDFDLDELDELDRLYDLDDLGTNAKPSTNSTPNRRGTAPKHYNSPKRSTAASSGSSHDQVSQLSATILEKRGENAILNRRIEEMAQRHLDEVENMQSSQKEALRETRKEMQKLRDEIAKIDRENKVLLLERRARISADSAIRASSQPPKQATGPLERLPRSSYTNKPQLPTASLPPLSPKGKEREAANRRKGMSFPGMGDGFLVQSKKRKAEAPKGLKTHLPKVSTASNESLIIDVLSHHTMPGVKELSLTKLSKLMCPWNPKVSTTDLVLGATKRDPKYVIGLLVRTVIMVKDMLMTPTLLALACEILDRTSFTAPARVFDLDVEMSQSSLEDLTLTEPAEHAVEDELTFVKLQKALVQWLEELEPFAAVSSMGPVIHLDKNTCFRYTTILYALDLIALARWPVKLDTSLLSSVIASTFPQVALRGLYVLRADLRRGTRNLTGIDEVHLFNDVKVSPPSSISFDILFGGFRDKHPLQVTALAEYGHDYLTLGLSPQETIAQMQELLEPMYCNIKSALVEAALCLPSNQTNWVKLIHLLGSEASRPKIPERTKFVSLCVRCLWLWSEDVKPNSLNNDILLVCLARIAYLRDGYDTVTISRAGDLLSQQITPDDEEEIARSLGTILHIY